MERQRDAAGFNSHLAGSLAVTAPSGGLGSKSVMVALNGKTIQHQLATLDLKSFGKSFAPRERAGRAETWKRMMADQASLIGINEYDAARGSPVSSSACG